MRLPGPNIWGPPRDRAAAIAVLRKAVELGVTHIDTSAAYGPDVANELIREALHPYGSVVIATKVGVARDDSMAFLSAASPSELRHQVEENLKTLDVEALDLVYLRAGGDGLLPDGPTPFAESFAALAEMRERGLIRHLGLSGVTLARLDEACTISPVIAVQNRFHLYDRGSSDVLEACERNGIGFVPYFPLAAGMLAPSTALDRIAALHGASRAQVALAWLLRTSRVTLAIPGTASLAHQEENMAAADIELTEDDIARLDCVAA